MRLRDKVKRLRTRLAVGCGRCEYDEAEGAVFNHCADCRFLITRWTYELLITEGWRVMAPIRRRT